MPALPHTHYRPDIDGLRAIAILSVVAFHAFPGLVKGGFIGVDIFFVISGFLISQILFAQMETGRFSYRQFYARRIRRIFPALMVVLVTVMGVGYGLQLADDYLRTGLHTAAGALFVANFAFWREAGYFDVAADTKPLLHLWSLGVEEQFYIFWPLFLGLMGRRHQDFLRATCCLAALSFVYCLYETFNDTTAAFYSPFTRLWELMAGGLLAYVGQHRHRFLESQHNVKSVLGLILLIAGFAAIHKDGHFPGAWALLPVGGAFLLIAAGPNAPVNKHVLAHPVAVFIGLISYPLYLWHWPILVFLRLIAVEPHRIQKIEAIIVSVVLAYLTTRFIEGPVRRRSGNGVVGLLLAISVTVVLCGAAVFLTDGFPARDANKGSIAKDLSFRVDTHKFAPCPKGLQDKDLPLEYCLQSHSAAPEYAIFGDSHAEDKFYGLAKKDVSHSWILVGHDSCPPVAGLSVTGIVKNCEGRSENILNWLIQQTSIRTVVLSHYGNYFLESDYAADHKTNKVGPDTLTFRVGGKVVQGTDKQRVFEQGLDMAITQLEQAGKKVVLLVDVPELPFFPKDCARKDSADGHCHLSRQEVEDRQKVYRQILQSLAKRHKNLRLFDPLTFLCTAQSCNYRTEDMLIYRDSHHLSLRGSDYYAEKFLTWLKAQPRT